MLKNRRTAAKCGDSGRELGRPLRSNWCGSLLGAAALDVRLRLLRPRVRADEPVHRDHVRLDRRQQLAHREPGLELRV